MEAAVPVSKPSDVDLFTEIQLRVNIKEGKDKIRVLHSDWFMPDELIDANGP